MSTSTADIWWNNSMNRNTDLMNIFEEEKKWLSESDKIERKEEWITTTIPNPVKVRQDTSWDSSQIVKIFNNKWATDEWIADSYIEIANNATKGISTKDDWLIEIPDYWNRREALKDIAKIKWLFNKETSW